MRMRTHTPQGLLGWLDRIVVYAAEASSEGSEDPGEEIAPDRFALHQKLVLGPLDPGEAAARQSFMIVSTVSATTIFSSVPTLA